MARMAGDDNGRPKGPKTRGDRRPDCLRRDHAPAGLCRDRQVCQSPGAAGKIHPHRDVGDHLPGVGFDAVAGHRIGDAGVLRAGRSRSDHVIAGQACQCVLGSHRGDRAVGDGDGAVVVGAGFVIALQIAAILSYGTLSRFAVLTSDAAAAFAPDLDSLVWWPARAALGDGEALLLLLAGGLILLGAVMAIFSPRFADTIVRASANAAPALQGARTKAFRAGSRQQALRWKEFVLLRRDPWLVSQTLMQLLYLVPPALMLWRSFSDSSLA